MSVCVCLCLCVSVSRKSPKEQYVDGVLERAGPERTDKDNLEDKWRVMRAALVDTAEAVLGKVKKRQPDWFQDSEDHLTPYLQARNCAYRKWLDSSDRQDLMSFREARGRSKREVRRAKEKWLKRKADEAERERFGRKRFWQKNRKLQCARWGSVPARVVTIQDEKGRPCKTTIEQREHWRRHFHQVLMVQIQMWHL